MPEVPSPLAVIRQYTQLGIQHIWAGTDHLLFILCLIFVAGIGSKLWWTITGFTLTHSITLGLSAMNIIDISVGAVEACIALSILFLATEIAKFHTNRQSLTYRYPVVVSSIFGLLHGMGFAAVLSEIGLPQSSKITALLFFNIGVEIGQILFIIGLLVIAFLAKKILLPHIHHRAEVSSIALKIGIYAIGSLAAFWLFTRMG